MDFLFNPETHEYSVDGVILPSVSDIIAPLKDDFSNVHPDVLERARAWGNAVHDMVKYWLEDNLDEDALDDALRPCLRAFKRFWADELKIGVDELQVETPLYCDIRMYAGTPDLMYLRGGTPAIIDIKTRKYNKVLDPLQLAGYCGVTDWDYGYVNKYILELTEKGEYIFRPAHHDMAWDMFLILWHRYRKERDFEKDILIWREATKARIPNGVKC